MYEKKLDVFELFQFIRHYKKETGLIAKNITLAERFGVSTMLVSRKLMQLEKLGLIKRIKVDKYYKTYEIL